MEGLLNNVLSAKAMGFEGMGCIHPRQIAVIREGFSPSPQELEKAKKIVIAYRDALEKGLGVVALGTKMIDPPVVARAEKTITLAVRLGLLPENWIDLEESKN
jgi:citrate lyase subunit beta/citryl-CoA lyase